MKLGTGTGSASPVRSQPPPVWLMRHVVNPTVRALVGSPLGRRTGRLSLLRFDGRRTGRVYAVPVIVHVVDGQPTVFTDGSWAANFRGGHPLTLVTGGLVHPAYAAVVDDPRIVGATIRSAIAQQGSARRLGLAIDAGHVPTDEELCAVRCMIRLRTTTYPAPGNP